MARLVLASTSPYRRELLSRLRLPFEVLAPDIDEIARDAESPMALAQRLAQDKAHAAARHVGTRDAVIVAADQTAARDEVLLRKPGTHLAAIDQLRACQGKSVRFFTAATIIDCRTGSAWHDIDVTEVAFRQRSDEALDRYLRIEQPYDCVGGFKAEGLGITLFAAIQSRDPTALIGLPLIWVGRVLEELGLDPLRADS
ncbi:MAG TPA: Maf family nucleotide pyrophosphatase [Gammaproteobacteria bacterium]|nr:Maf family nucleotide pyrophosphatase [Gammaproteobacteria bacterium]